MRNEMSNDVINGLWKKIKTKLSGPVVGTLIMILFITVLFAIVAPRYLLLGNMSDILKTISIKFIIALALGIVIASGGFDLSVGHIAGFSGLVTAYMMVNLRMNIPVSIFGGIGVGVLIGCVNGMIVAWLGVSSFITTLAMQMLIVGLRYGLTNGTTIMRLPKAFRWLGNGSVLGIPFLVIMMLVILLIMIFSMHCTTLGRRIISTGQNMETSWLSGINPRIYTWLALVISGALCSIAGILMVSRNELANVDVGDGYLMEAIATAVFAHVMFGKFKVYGVILMTTFIAMLINGLTMIGVTPSSMNIVRGVMLIVVIGFGKIMQHLRSRRFV
jgi:ribose/xylose/arabinose/galactoside ABC-type transport system permease subunit